MTKLKRITVNKLSVILLVALLIYMGLINYNIPFVTLDEFISITFSENNLDEAIKHGRLSHLFSFLSRTLTSFEVPSIIGLTPRYLTMILLTVSLIIFLVHSGLSGNAAIFATAFTIISHQIDWMHNGFIAFFGNFNIFLALFLLAVVLDGLPKKKYYFIIIFIFLIFSYGSELFLGMSFIYLLVKSYLTRRYGQIYQSPFFFAIITYVILFLVLSYFSDPIAGAAMKEYLIGKPSEDKAKYESIIKATILYIVNSVPYLSLNIYPALSLGTIVLGCSVLFVLRMLSFRTAKKPTKEVVNTYASNQTTSVILLATLLITPQFLMANQPMKAYWILSGASNRYIYSFYTWIAIIFLFALFINVIKKNVIYKKKKIIIFIAVPVIIFLTIYIGKKNIEFSKTYINSKNNFLQIQKIISTETGDEVGIPEKLLEQFYILPISSVNMKKYVHTVYNKNSKICYNAGKIQNDHPLYKLEGFHQLENDGVWSTNSAKIKFKINLKQGTKLRVEFTDSLASNLSNDSLIKFGNVIFRETITPGHFIEININELMELPELIITPYAVLAPAELGYSGDDRKLGLKLKSISILSYNEKKSQFEILDYCY
jgi:hypothetical protein